MTHPSIVQESATCTYLSISDTQSRLTLRNEAPASRGPGSGNLVFYGGK